jgi:hypothetical protein
LNYADCDGTYQFTTGRNNWPYLVAKCEQLEGQSWFKEVTTHYYVGGSPNINYNGSKYTVTPTQAIDDMLSSDWVNGVNGDGAIGWTVTGASGAPTDCSNTMYCNQYTPYAWEFTHIVQPVLNLGTPVRFTEANDFLGGVAQASNFFASALWALDFTQWWAANGAAGVNIFNQPWIYTDTIIPTDAVGSGGGQFCTSTCTGFFSNPKGFAIKAFNFGGHGYTEPVGTISNSSLSGLVDVYAVGDAQDVNITAVNKTHDSGINNATDVSLTIYLNGSFQAGSVATMELSSGTDGAANIGGAMLAGVSSNYLNYGANGPNGGAPVFTQFTGAWNNTIHGFSGGSLTVTVPAASALLIRLSAGYHYNGPVQIDQNGAQEMFATDSSGNIWHVWQSAGKLSQSPNSPASNWTGWDSANSTLGWTEQSMSTGSGNITATGSPVVIKNQDNTLQVFVPTSGDVYYQQQSTPGGAWGAWTDMGSGSNGLTNIQVAQNADDSLSVFGLDASGNLWTASELAPGTGWHGAWTGAWQSSATWTELPTLVSAGGNGGFGGGYTVGRNLNGRLEIFAVGKNGSTPVVWHIWQISQNSPTGTVNWGAWANLNAPSAGLALATKLQVARNLSGDLTVFAVDNSVTGAHGGGYVNTMAQVTPSGGWSSWSKFNSTLTLQPGFVVGQDSNGNFEVLGVQTGAATGAVYDITSTSSDTIGTQAQNPNLVVSNRLDGRLQAFGVDASGNVYSNWQTTTGGAWQSDWTNDFSNVSSSGAFTAMSFYQGQP